MQKSGSPFAEAQFATAEGNESSFIHTCMYFFFKSDIF